MPDYKCGLLLNLFKKNYISYITFKNTLFKLLNFMRIFLKLIITQQNITTLLEGYYYMLLKDSVTLLIYNNSN